MVVTTENLCRNGDERALTRDRGLYRAVASRRR